MRNQPKKMLLLTILALLCLAILAGCSSAPATPPEPAAAPEPAAPPVTEAHKVLLVVSFGTSYNNSRDITIGGVENALQAAYPDYEMRRAFTSQIIIDKLEERDGLQIDNVTEAMERLVADGVTDVVIQPTHVMCGFEYDDAVADVSPYKDKFASFSIGNPLLIDDADYERLVSILAEETAAYNVEGTAIVFMGHGTEHEANATYAKMQQHITDAGYGNYFIGTVEAEPALEDVMEMVAASGATRVVLEPLMIVAGDHANNDMAGDEEDSWKSEFEAAGYEVECVLKGLGQFPGVQQLFVEHAAAAMGLTAAAGPLRPIYAGQLADGTYDIEVSSSSTMFRIVNARLTVADGEMSVVLTLSGTGYEKLYMGTGREAEAGTDDKCVYFVEDSEGKYTYTVPIDALDQNTDVAAWSIRKETWYDRVLVFQSALIPAEAFVG